MKLTKISLLILSVTVLGIYSCSKPEEKQASNGNMEKNKEAMMKVFGMFESGNSEGIENWVDANIVEHSPAPFIKTTGIQGLKDIIAAHHAGFPDTKITVLSWAADGDIMFAHYKMTGTNTGSMGPDMPATNKAIDVNGVDIVRFENGKGLEHWGYWDEQKFKEQLGMGAGAPPPPTDSTKKM